MKKILLTFLFLYSLQTSAQGRYCTSFNDYLEDNWIEVPTLTINRHSKSAPKPNEAIDYSFTSNDETTDTHLDERAVFVQCNDFCSSISANSVWDLNVSPTITLWRIP